MKLFFSTSIFLLILLNATAQGVQVNLQGQKQIAMGSTGTGLLTDAAAVFFNPGAVSFLQKSSLTMGINPTLIRSRFTEAQPGTTTVVNKPAINPPFHAYATFGKGALKWKAGIGIYTPYGGQINWGNQWIGRFALQSFSLQVVCIQPTFSYKITSKLGIGTGFVLGGGAVDLRRSLYLNTQNGGDGAVTLKGFGAGIGYNVGIYWKPDSVFSLGINYRSKVVATVKKGSAVFNVPAILPANYFPSNNSFSTQTPLPGVASIGIGYRFNKKLILVADANYTFYNVFDSLRFNFEKNSAVLTDIRSARVYKNCSAGRLGLQYLLNEKLPLRVGFAYTQTPVPNGYVTPETPDADRIHISGGFGYQASKKLTIDASFLWIHLLKRSQQNIETNLNGSYETYVYVFGIGASWQL
jgi:long-chain fatty acid transport protein